MSSDSETESPHRSPHRSRLQHIWNSIQQTKEISHLYDRRPTSHHKYHHQEFQEEDCQEYENREVRENLAHMVKKVKKLEEENRVLKFKLEEQRYSKDVELASVRRDYEERLRSQLRKMKASQKQNMGVKQGSQVDILTRDNERLCLRLKALQLEVKSCQDERNRLTQLNELYVEKLSQGRMDSEGALGKGQQLLQLEEATQTVCRLVQLLRRTEQYRQYAPMMQQIGDMHYLKNILKRLKNNQLNFKPQARKVCHCRQIKVSQKLLWSPVECYKLMLEMKMKYDYLNEECIEEVLFQINRIYASKQQKSLKKMKGSYEQEIARLKKQIQHGYDEVLTKKQVSRLKKQLSVVKSVQKSRQPLPMTHFKDKGQLADQLKLRQKEIKLLKERIRIFQTQNGFQDKSLYYQGTICALDKVLGQLEGNQASLKEFQIKFRERVQQNIQPEDWLVSYKQFFQTLTELSGGLVERVLMLKQSMLKKMGRGVDF